MYSCRGWREEGIETDRQTDRQEAETEGDSHFFFLFRVWLTGQTADMYIFVCECVCVCVRVCEGVRTTDRTDVSGTCVRAYTHMCVYLCVFVCVCVCASTEPKLDTTDLCTCL